MKKLLFIIALATLSACQGSDLKTTLGINKSAPDEFHVVSNPPLSVPPKFSLEDPEEHSTAFFENIGSNSNVELDSSDVKFLDSISHQSSKTKEMLAIDEEYRVMREKEQSNSVKKALNYLRGDSSDPVIDPVSEKKRISDNRLRGIDINSGKIKDKKSSTLSKIFN